MAKNKQKFASAFILLAIILSAFSLFSIRTQAASPTGVYGGVAPSVFMWAVDDVEDDFNLGVSEWSVSRGSAECVSEMAQAPYSPYE